MNIPFLWFAKYVEYRNRVSDSSKVDFNKTILLIINQLLIKDNDALLKHQISLESILISYTKDHETYYHDLEIKCDIYLPIPVIIDFDNKMCSKSEWFTKCKKDLSI